jgi:hypothetical protein
MGAATPVIDRRYWAKNPKANGSWDHFNLGLGWVVRGSISLLRLLQDLGRILSIFPKNSAF